MSAGSSKLFSILLMFVNREFQVCSKTHFHGDFDWHSQYSGKTDKQPSELFFMFSSSSNSFLLLDLKTISFLLVLDSWNCTTNSLHFCLFIWARVSSIIFFRCFWQWNGSFSPLQWNPHRFRFPVVFNNQLDVSYSYSSSSLLLLSYRGSCILVFRVRMCSWMAVTMEKQHCSPCLFWMNILFLFWREKCTNFRFEQWFWIRFQSLSLQPFFFFPSPMSRP